MNSRKITLLSGAALLLIGGVVVIKRNNSERTDEARDVATDHSSGSQGVGIHGQPGKVVQEQGRSSANHAGLATMSLEDKAAALVAMREAATSYDPSQLPVIQPYLLSSDPEIRQRAVDSMVNLGDAAAVPMLREAAKQLESPKEVMALLKAAEWLEMPPLDVAKMRERMKKRPKSESKSTTGTPGVPHGAGPNRLPQTAPQAPKEEMPR